MMCVCVNAQECRLRRMAVIAPTAIRAPYGASRDYSASRYPARQPVLYGQRAALKSVSSAALASLPLQLH